MKNFLPPEILKKLETTGPFVDEIHQILRKIFAEKGFTEEKDLLGLTDAEIETLMAGMPPFSATEKKHITLYEDPWAQLQVAINQVLSSWNSTKAKQYRKIMGISDSWGTAVIVQAMVFGNLSLSAGSGVVFTAHPYHKIRRVALWGDFTPGNQGEDIQEISLTNGLLTAKGGQTSHAAIVAFELDKTAVVGCRNMVVLENEGRLLINRTEVQRGDYVSLDGKKGLVYLGRHEIKAEGDANPILV